MIPEPTTVRHLSPTLAQRLRRLGLLDDNDALPELDGELPREVQVTLAMPSGARSAIRLWADSQVANRQLSTTALLIVLDHLRERPHEAAPLLDVLPGPMYRDALADCALETARQLYRAGRQHYADANVDISVNYMVEARREFLFALSAGRMDSGARTEALGKYAVAVAFASRWVRTNASILNRARNFQLNSITSGNTSIEAYSYLVELITELFNVTGETAHLDEALAIAESKRLVLAQAELHLKRGVWRAENQETGSTRDLQLASQLAGDFKPRTGVDYVRTALIQQFALAAILRPCPLRAVELRLPYGFLVDLPRLGDDARALLKGDVLAALEPMRRILKERGSQPNLVAQQVLLAVLRDAVVRPSTNSTIHDADALVQVAQEAADRGGDRYLEWQRADAMLVRAGASGDPGHIAEAIAASSALTTAHPVWPLPRVTLARALQLNEESDSAVEGSVLDQAESAWTEAARLVVECPDFRRSDLGGRSSVFAVEDARGDLSTALVFKPVASPADGEREAMQMAALATGIGIRTADDRFGVPTSLGVVTLGDGKSVHVIERQLGRLLSDMDRPTASSYLAACAELLSIFHSSAGTPQAGRTGWGPLKDGLKLYCRALFDDPTNASQFVEDVRSALPVDLPLVRKRDAHVGNWVVDGAERIIAIDLEGAAFLPVPHDLAQLIEDGALLPVDERGFAIRYQLLSSYLQRLDLDLDPALAEIAYDWFALYRAVWLATSASASKAQHAHARQLAHHIALNTKLDGLRRPAESAAAAMRQLVPRDAAAAPPDGTRRRLSKRLSLVLRHRAPELGLAVDTAGYVDLVDLSIAIDEKVDDIVAAATHPSEPRFQVEDGAIRALYGHSFAVADLPDLDVERPHTLYHGTSWDALPRIAAEGLRPMGRQRVHLTIDPGEALEVARRHPLPVLLAVSVGEDDVMQAVADAVWAAETIRPMKIHVRNPFTEMSTAPAWLAEAITAEALSSDGGS